MDTTSRPCLECPECLHPLIPADTHDADGWWWTNEEPVTCPCGCVARVAFHDDGGAYAEMVTPAPVEP
jgi:hypothetical protein